MCDRCKRTGHKKKNCFATKDVDGNNLDPKTAAKKPDGRGKGRGRGRGRSKGGGNPNSNPPAPNGGKLSDILSGIKANKTSMSLDDVKAAISNATSMHVKTTPVDEADAQPDDSLSPAGIHCKRVQEEQAALAACIQSLEDITMQAAQQRQQELSIQEARGIDDDTLDLLMSLGGHEAVYAERQLAVKSRAASCTQPQSQNDTATDTDSVAILGPKATKRCAAGGDIRDIYHADPERDLQ